MSEVNLNDLTNKVFEALEKQPELLVPLTTASEEATRVMPGEETAETKMIRGILGNVVTDEAINNVTRSLNDNSIMQLLMNSEGALDPKDLLAYTGGFVSSEKANPSNNSAVRALFDGKLEIKEILMLIALLKLFKGKNQQQTSSGGLLGSLFGSKPSSNYNQLNTISSLLSGNTATNSSLFGNLFSSLPQQQVNNGAIAFGNQASNNEALSNVLGNLLSGNTGNNQQAQLLYNVLNSGSQNAFTSSGQLDAGTLFSIASQLLR